MSLSYLRSRLEELRSQASRIQTQYARDLAEVNSNDSLSNTGKAEAKNRIYENAKASAAGLRDREKELIANERSTLQARLNLTSGGSSSDIISFRDAQDRADAIADADEAARIMTRALSSKDTTLAAAIFRRATEQRTLGGAIWAEARRLYTDANPSAGDAISDLAGIEQLENAGFNRAMAYGIFRP